MRSTRATIWLSILILASAWGAECWDAIMKPGGDNYPAKFLIRTAGMEPPDFGGERLVGSTMTRGSTNADSASWLCNAGEKLLGVAELQNCGEKAASRLARVVGDGRKKGCWRSGVCSCRQREMIVLPSSHWMHHLDHVRLTPASTKQDKLLRACAHGDVGPMFKDGERADVALHTAK